MSEAPHARFRFSERLKQFLAGFGEERLAPETGGTEAEQAPFPAIDLPASDEADSFDAATTAAEERLSLDQKALNRWQDELETRLEARRRRRSLHGEMLRENARYLDQVIAGAQAREEEPPDPIDGSLPPVTDPQEAFPAAPPPEPFSVEELSGFVLPGSDLLAPAEETGHALPEREGVEEQRNRLQDALDSFAVDAFVYDAIVGPRVTQFRVKPGFGVRVEAIAALDRNITLALKVRAVRIQAPIPGEAFVGIEVPNGNSRPLRLRSALESATWRDDESEIPLALGMDISGRIVLGDLAKAPHLLIAGATGSGKSVCISNLILSLLYRFRPDELELVLVDPKRVEFALYKDLPHLIHPVVSEPKEACQALRWLVREMEKRYDEMSERKVRNIAGYNAKADAEGFPRMPYIVLIVDELADLMMTAREDVETPLARLAQMSRAVGIHTVLATQRPSVNIITGTIKANFPTRIAFQVSSQVDSRTILDSKGAESLQGRGDMLYNPPGIGKLLRLQAPYVDDEEIATVTNFLRGGLEPRYRVVLQSPEEDAEGIFSDEVPSGLDPLIRQALEIVATTGRASTSFLQRKLKIGYNRAANLMEELEDRGYVGPQIGSHPREVFVDPSELPSS